jgi:hypothetical protein
MLGSIKSEAEEVGSRTGGSFVALDQARVARRPPGNKWPGYEDEVH